MSDTGASKTAKGRADRQLSSDKEFDITTKKQKTTEDGTQVGNAVTTTDEGKNPAKVTDERSNELDAKSEEPSQTNDNSNQNPPLQEEEPDPNMQRKAYIMKRARKWELKAVKIANVWDFANDVVVNQWVRANEERSELEQGVPKEPSFFKVYRCKYPDCGKTFHDPNVLKKHAQLHSEKQMAEQKYACPVEGCGKRFLDNSKLRRHQLVHTGEKPFKCEVCGKLFSLDFNLRTHMRTHTGERPYACRFPNCNKRFTQSSNLVSHERMHYTRDVKAVDAVTANSSAPNET